MELTTARLVLRDFRTADRADVHLYAGDPEIARYTDWGPNTAEQTAGFLADAAQAAGELPRTVYPLAVVEREGGTVIGSVSLRVTQWDHRRGEVGYVVARSHWGRGFATEATGALVRFGFERLGLHRISATCDPDNRASAKVLRNVGMVQEGYLRDYLQIRGEWRDRLLFAVLTSP